MDELLYGSMVITIVTVLLETPLIIIQIIITGTSYERET